MALRRVSSRVACATTLAFLALSAGAQGVPEPTALSQTVSIGDVIRAEDTQAAATKTTALPIHLIYVHGMNDVGSNDSEMLQKAICRYLHECTMHRDDPMYAEGPFALTATQPNLTYLQQPIWVTPEEWHASAPFIQRYRISGGGHAPIVLDELNWYPLVYPLKCKFLLPGDAMLTGSVKDKLGVCQPKSNQPDSTSPGHFLSYRWMPNGPLFTTDLPLQHATLINRTLKVNVMDWGFGDAVLALGPMREIMTAAIRQLLAQSLANVVPVQAGAPQSADDEKVPVFFVTHSLGSYLSLTAMDSAWLGSTPTEVMGFSMSDEQAQAVDYFARHTTGFYFLANQIGLMELARISPPSADAQPDCSRAATQAVRSSPEPASAALSHYGCMRHNYLNSHAGVAPQNTGPQIIAWSAADDILSWYVPAVTGVAVVNLPAHNSGFRIPKLIASPASAHGNYAKSPSVVRGIFMPTAPH